MTNVLLFLYTYDVDQNFRPWRDLMSDELFNVKMIDPS